MKALGTYLTAIQRTEQSVRYMNLRGEGLSLTVQGGKSALVDPP